MPVTKTSWPKGRSGNSRGRPRLGDELGAILRQTVDRKRLAEKLCELCYAGDVQAMRLLLRLWRWIARTESITRYSATGLKPYPRNGNRGKSLPSKIASGNQ